jgi:hypothetical protein
MAWIRFSIALDRFPAGHASGHCFTIDVESATAGFQTALMEVHVTPEMAKKLTDLVATTGRGVDQLVQDALAAARMSSRVRSGKSLRI